MLLLLGCAAFDGIFRSPTTQDPEASDSSEDTQDGEDSEDTSTSGRPDHTPLPACVDDGVTAIPTHTLEFSTGPRDIICRPADQVFSLAVLPDTQVAVAHDPEMFEDQTRYLRSMFDHPDNNLLFVAHLGDLVDDPKSETHWTRARSAMDGLAAFESEGTQHFIPYDIAWGDHDLVSYDDRYEGYPDPDRPRPKRVDYITGSSSTSATYGFGVERYKAAHTLGDDEGWSGWFIGYDYRDEGRYGRSSYHFFDAGGDGYMLLFLEFCPAEDVLDWAEERLQWFATGDDARRVILVQHSFAAIDGGISDWKWTGKEVQGYEDWLPACWEFNGMGAEGTPGDVFQRLVVPYDVEFVLSGHDNHSTWKGGTYARYTVAADRWEGGWDRDVHVFVANYQHIESADAQHDGGLGYLRMMRFYPEQDRIEVKTWSQWSYDQDGDPYNPKGSFEEPLNFRGVASESFNEDTICTALGEGDGTAGSRPGNCLTWTEVPGACADLEPHVEGNTHELVGPPYRSFGARCNLMRLSYDMTGG